MKTYSTHTVKGVVLTTMLLLASSAVARSHSSLNGTWTLLPTRSNFSGQSVVQSGTVTINDREGQITVERHLVYQGADETFFYNDMTDGRRNDTFHSGKDFKSKTGWDHDVLKVTTTLSGAVTVESYSLADDDIMTVNVEGREHKSITLVFERK
jgi:hypothetical protein